MPDRKQPSVLKKEGTLFWEKQRKSIEVNLFVIDLDLREALGSYPSKIAKKLREAGLGTHDQNDVSDHLRAKCNRTRM